MLGVPARNELTKVPGPQTKLPALLHTPPLEAAASAAAGMEVAACQVLEPHAAHVKTVDDVNDDTYQPAEHPARDGGREERCK